MSRVRLDRSAHVFEEGGLFVAARDPHPLERGVEPDIDVESACILMEVQERVRTSREVTALAFPQLWEFA